MQLKRSYDIQLHYIFMTSINYACVKVKLCPPIIDFFSINNKPEALKSLYRSPGNKKKQLVLCKNYVLQW